MDCRGTCPWAAGCELVARPNPEPEPCNMATLLEGYWHSPEALVEWHEADRMRHKYEEECDTKQWEYQL